VDRFVDLFDAPPTKIKFLRQVFLPPNPCVGRTYFDHWLTRRTHRLQPDRDCQTLGGWNLQNKGKAMTEWLQLHRTPIFDDIMGAIALMSSGLANVLWAALVGWVLACRRQRREAALLLSGTALGSSLILILKPFFARPRPSLPHQIGSYSFPSGHVLSSTVFVGLLLCLGHRLDRAHRRWHIPLATIVLLLVGFSRLYLGAHWLTDVLGGYAMGGIFVWIYAAFVQI
jgi:undecaprenyl-diphosphatase